MQRVVVIYRRSLLAQGVEKLLSRVKDLEVIGLDLDDKEVMKRLTSFHPETVVMDNSEFHKSVRNLILNLWQENPAARFICLNMKKNEAEVLKHNQVGINTVDDLVQVLRTG